MKKRCKLHDFMHGRNLDRKCKAESQVVERRYGIQDLLSKHFQNEGNGFFEFHMVNECIQDAVI